MTTKITDANLDVIANKFINWQSVITADGSTTTTLVAGRGYIIDTTSAAHTVNLPATATKGDTIVIKDYAGTFGTNAVTINRNGNSIQGAANNSELTTNRASVTLVYIDSTKGWLFSDEHNVGELQNVVFITATGGTETTSGDYKIHTFTGDGTFTVCTVGNPAGSDSVDYMVVAGGGGGGSGGNYNGGGGGGGGFRESVPSPAAWSASPLANPGGALPVSVQGYPVTVGGGGAGGTGPNTSKGSSGSSSSFSSITSAGGGGGGAGGPGAPGASGGSGGGAGNDLSATKPGGTGNSPPVSPPQGESGGTSPGGGGNSTDAKFWYSAGGGGATDAGNNGFEFSTPAQGGDGATTSISGSPSSFSGGGGGAGGINPSPNRSPGGTGGGGIGSNSPTRGTDGSPNTGGGGGGAFNGPSGLTGLAGGKGIVVIRYKYQ